MTIYAQFDYFYVFSEFRRCVQKMVNNMDICRNGCHILQKTKSLKFPKPTKFKKSFSISFFHFTPYPHLIREGAGQRPEALPAADVVEVDLEDASALSKLNRWRVLKLIKIK